jgi:HD-GYP domain-containing protein (c-di-GMP phosphodiesterase class II)
MAAVTPEIVHALVAAIELKDQSTAAHTWRVVLYTRALAEEAGESRESIQRLTLGAALHDIGKLGVSSAILTKPGPLTTRERGLMQQHAEHGYDLLAGMGETDPLVLDIVRHHHERWDGAGYPDGLRGERIAPAARLFAVVDSFDAMTSIRPYRRDIGLDAADRAIVELKAGAGTRYWPPAVEMFERLFGTGRLEWILSYYNDASSPPRFGPVDLADVGRAEGAVRIGPAAPP